MNINSWTEERERDPICSICCVTSLGLLTKQYDTVYDQHFNQLSAQATFKWAVDASVNSLETIKYEA